MRTRIQIHGYGHIHVDAFTKIQAYSMVCIMYPCAYDDFMSGITLGEMNIWSRV
jgi:hypothetical protein